LCLLLKSESNGDLAAGWLFFREFGLPLMQHLERVDRRQSVRVQGFDFIDQRMSDGAEQSHLEFGFAAVIG